MATPIEGYALLGDTQTAALVSLEGSIDWFCPPRFDAPACFAALLGDAGHGRWLLTAAARSRTVRRRYRGDTLVLETDYETPDGAVTVIDTMAPASNQAPGRPSVDLVRLVVGRSGRVQMHTELAIRFGYGLVAPVLQWADRDLLAVCGPDALRFSTPLKLDVDDRACEATFSVAAGETVPFVLTWFPSHLPAPPRADAEQLIEVSQAFWDAWAARCTYRGEWREPVIRSLITLKALTYEPTGGIVAAASASLPEVLGGSRNWDYRYCWLRDAAFTVSTLRDAGYPDEALAWRSWLLRAGAGDPAHLQVLYGPAGERHIPEWHADWLPGYEQSKPVRIGNAAANQFQLDVYGELADSQYRLAVEYGFHPGQQQVIERTLNHLEQTWSQADEGIWEIRGERRHFVHSKVMAWVAFDRAVKLCEHTTFPGPLARWRDLRDHIHAEICREGFDPDRNTFVQSYGSRELDASLLRLARVGFLAPDDPRVVGTVDAILQDLHIDNGLLLRYSTEAQGAIDGIAEPEGAFLACSFWLADNLALIGRREHACEVFEHLLALRNDVGLLAEEYDPVARRQLGNYPQAYSHLALVNTALLLETPAP